MYMRYDIIDGSMYGSQYLLLLFILYIQEQFCFFVQRLIQHASVTDSTIDLLVQFIVHILNFG